MYLMNDIKTVDVAIKFFYLLKVLAECFSLLFFYLYIPAALICMLHFPAVDVKG